MATIGEILYGVGADTTRLRAALNDVKNFGSAMTSAAEQIQASSQRAASAMDKAAASAKRAGEANNTFADGMRNLARAAALTSGPLSGVAFRITLLGELLSKGTLGTALFVAGAAGAAYGMAKLGEAAVALETHLTQVRNSIFTLSGSAMQTRQDLNFLMQTADQSGLAFMEVAHSFAAMEQAARGTRLQGEGIREMFAQIMQIAGATTMSQEKLAGTLGFVERMLSLGVVQWRNLREAARDIPNIMNLVGDAIGVHTTAGIEKFLKLGTMTADVLLPKLIAAWAKTYGITAQTPVDNLVASHNRLQNAIVRFNNALDQSVGLSASAQRTYDALTKVLDTLSRNIETVIKVAAVGAGALVGMGSSYIATGLLAVARAVGSIATAVGALDVAMLVSPGGALLKLLATIAGAIAAYYVLGDSVKTTTDGLITGKIAVDEYVKSWDKFKTGFSSSTIGMINDTEKNIAQLKAQMQSAADVLKAAQDEADKQKAFSSSPQYATVIKQVNDAQAAYNKWAGAVKNAEQGLQELQRVLNEQRKAESNVPGQKPGENQAMMRMLNALEKVREATREANQEWQGMQDGSYAAAKAIEQAKIDKSIQDIRVQLQQAGYDWDRLTQKFTDSKVQLAFEQFTAATQRLKDTQLFDKYFIQGWQLLETAIQDVTTKGIDGMITALEKGKLTWKSMEPVAIQVIDAIIKKLMELAVINPFLSALFGGSSKLPTFVLSGPGTQPGGFFGWLFGTGGSGAPGTAPGAGQSSASYIQHTGARSTTRQVPTSLFYGAPRLHGGLDLSADEYPAILQRGEQVIPRGKSGSGSNVTINIAHPTDTQAEVRKSSVGGADMYNIIIGHVQRGIGEGKFDLNNASRYGSRPAPIRR